MIQEAVVNIRELKRIFAGTEQAVDDIPLSREGYREKTFNYSCELRFPVIKLGGTQKSYSISEVSRLQVVSKTGKCKIYELFVCRDEQPLCQQYCEAYSLS
ncbi:uncharacterized protein PHALS_09015 [Plasmopara halstedii]|uniref:Uncharacterized protein n=1 Tax=Plasmopara halstedii TaxID=4781 RepID=A0A0P1ADB6_PLAHL|nr:uncharacterized protein PHALS_09015 [Plasmopara halstedii]CEG38973.1 hypothetical protein PHALS_09015 [Plasmopara halstedii]|eukprot:XP_024575342.1 hypothetical protein PHALS_09015 [Plasmopara halstedii]